MSPLELYSAQSSGPSEREQFGDPCIRVVVFPITKNLAEDLSEVDEILLGSGHSMGFGLMSFC